MSNRATEIAGLLRKAANAPTLAEKQDLVRRAEELKNEQHEASLTRGEWVAEDARIADHLVPGFAHELHTASTDWLMDLETEIDPREASRNMVAEASLWFGRVSDEVKSYPEEYAEQAKNLARKLSGQYGDYADTAENTFVTEANRLRSTAVRSGLVVEADAGQAPEENKGPAQKKWERVTEGDLEREKDGNTKSFENKAASRENCDSEFKGLKCTKEKGHDGEHSTPWEKKESSYEDTADEEQDDKDDESPDNPFKTSGMVRAAAVEQGVQDLFAVLAASDNTEVVGNPGTYNDHPELVNSNRAPIFQELDSNSQDSVAVNDPGLGHTEDRTGANGDSGERDHASKSSFPVSGKKESSMAQKYASCPTCGGHGKLAVREPQLPNIEDISKFAVSGLDQIDQTVDPHDNGPKPTAYPADVAFAWVLNPQGQIPAAIDQAEEQINQRNSLSPTMQNRSKQPATRAASARTAGGRDNSGWMGDNGLRGPDYPGEQVGQYPAPSTSEGYVDPVYGQGGDNGNQPQKPYGAAEATDYTSNPGMNWQPGSPTQADNGWRETVNQNPALASAAAFLEQHRQAYLRNGR